MNVTASSFKTRRETVFNEQYRKPIRESGSVHRACSTMNSLVASFPAPSRIASPFARQVDAWWAAIAIGVQYGERTPLPTDQVKFNDGGILNSDPWRITHLELLALAEGGDAAMLDKPAEVIRMVSEYANTGFPYLLDHLMGQTEPTLNLIMRLNEVEGSP